MPEQRFEWRACARDEGDTGIDGTIWKNDEPWVRRHFREMLEADPPYDEVWIERREVMYGPVERIDV